MCRHLIKQLTPGGNKEQRRQRGREIKNTRTPMECLTQKKKEVLEKHTVDAAMPANQSDGKEAMLHGRDKDMLDGLK